MLIGRFCPNTLYPFAREAIADVVGKGGFPQFLLQPHQLRRALRAGAASERAARGDGQTAGAAPSARGDSLARRAASRCSAPAPGARRSQYSSRARATRPCCGHAIVPRPTRWPRARRNARYLPDAPFPAQLEVDARSARGRRSAPRSCSSPCRARRFRTLLEALAAAAACAGSRGRRRASSSTRACLPYQVVAELLADSIPTAVLSGPTFAREVGAGPADRDDGRLDRRAYAQQLAASISTDTFRAYTSNDVDRRRGRRRDEERLRDRRRHLRRPRLRREHANRVDRARARRDDAPRARARRARARRSWASPAWAISC